MEIEQLLALMYFFLGMLAAFLSNFFSLNLTLAVSVPFIVYAASLIPLLKIVRKKKIKWLISNTFLTFVLVWVVVWIFLYNL